MSDLSTNIDIENLGEGKLEELLEEMPTGQEELTRERKERLKEVWQFKLFCQQNFRSVLFLQAKDCLLKTIGEDAKRLVSLSLFTQLYHARDSSSVTSIYHATLARDCLFSGNIKNPPSPLTSVLTLSQT